jgi:hypothetical protein
MSHDDSIRYRSLRVLGPTTRMDKRQHDITQRTSLRRCLTSQFKNLPTRDGSYDNRAVDLLVDSSGPCSAAHYLGPVSTHRLGSDYSDSIRRNRSRHITFKSRPSLHLSSALAYSHFQQKALVTPNNAPVSCPPHISSLIQPEAPSLDFKLSMAEMHLSRHSPSPLIVLTYPHASS